MKVSLPKIVKKFLQVTTRLGLVLLCSILLAVILRVFVLSSFKIPTPSMTPAIQPGDYILVNKLILGPRLFKNTRFLEGGKVETFRLPGFRKIKHNDILVFNFPYSGSERLRMDINVYYVKRCVAIPGDTFYIKDAFYHVKGCGDTLGNYPNQMAYSKLLHEGAMAAPQSYPYAPSHPWTVQLFGPLYIPKAKDVLPIDTGNVALYGRLIEYETDQSIIISNDTVFLDNRPLACYRFRYNYYLMAGDNVIDSKDSRFWGLLPEDHIVGKATQVWKSVDPSTGKWRMERVMERIR